MSGAKGAEGRDIERFRHVGFWTNPFEAVPFERLASFVPPPALVVLLARESWDVLQLIGESGSGKTTAGRFLLHQISARSSGGAYDHLAPRQSTVRAPASGAFAWFVDEAQRLGFFGRRRVRRWVEASPGRRLILGTHSDLSPLFRCRVRTVRLETSLTAFEAVVDARIQRYRLDGARVPEIHPDALPLLHLLCDANFHRMERTLYDLMEQRTDSSIIRPEEIEAAIRSVAEH